MGPRRVATTGSLGSSANLFSKSAFAFASAALYVHVQNRQSASGFLFARKFIRGTDCALQSRTRARFVIQHVTNHADVVLNFSLSRQLGCAFFQQRTRARVITLLETEPIPGTYPQWKDLLKLIGAPFPPAFGLFPDPRGARHKYKKGCSTPCWNQAPRPAPFHKRHAPWDNPWSDS